jgi:hypothetical protein
VRLAEHGDFKTLIARTSADQSLPESWVEKDYYLTEVLRIVARAYRPKVFSKAAPVSQKAGLSFHECPKTSIGYSSGAHLHQLWVEKM